MTLPTKNSLSDANEAKPWRVQWKEGGERLASRRSRDEVRVNLLGYAAVKA